MCSEYGLALLVEYSVGGTNVIRPMVVQALPVGFVVFVELAEVLGAAEML